ncbi:MAG: flagellar protein, partial [bacterium]|nr:flagellar protein [bacterium]
MNISSKKFSSIEQIRDQLNNNETQLKRQGSVKKSESFQSIYEKQKLLESDDLKFSKHACERLAS